MKSKSVFSDTERRAVEMCLERNLPFALFAYPGKEFRFVASTPSEDECRNEWEAKNSDWNGFLINFFGNEEQYVTGVRDMFSTPEAAIEFLTESRSHFPESYIEPPCNESTDRLKYISVASTIVSRLKREGGKTVFSRVIVKPSQRSVTDVADAYFSCFPDTFRYICFTQETGLWMGATPEIIADYTTSTGLLHTMALAGTLPLGDEEWDVKNIEEHSYVTGYIYETLEKLGATEIMAADPEEIVFGRVRHMCTPIKARLKSRNMLRGMLYALSPTPAVAGTPRGRAIPEIFLCETHSRLCYGGFVGTKEGRKLRVWANLRCATVRNDNPRDPSDLTYYVFAGGGYTSRSKPEAEWDEGTAKTAFLVEAIDPHN